MDEPRSAADVAEEFLRAVDNSAWDGPAAMSACANSDDPAACYRAICAGRRTGDPDLQSSWALPHHKRQGGPANAAGVRNSLSRLPQTQGLTNTDAARSHLQAHLREINAGAASRPPRDSLVRAVYPGAVEVRESAGVPPTLFGHFAVFDQWTEIDSLWEGHFLERIAPGAFKKTFQEQAQAIRVLFQHGRDPVVGDKPLAVPATLREDEMGAYYEAPMFDTSYNRDLIPALQAGAYGASFRFQVTKEEFDKEPVPGAHNPKALPERTIKEVQLFEFGPVTFPAYANATAGVRSMTDDYIIAKLGGDPHRLDELLAQRSPALPDDGAGDDHSDEASREEAAEPVKPETPAPQRRIPSQEEFVASLEEHDPWT